MSISTYVIWQVLHSPQQREVGWRRESERREQVAGSAVVWHPGWPGHCLPGPAAAAEDGEEGEEARWTERPGLGQLLAGG